MTRPATGLGAWLGAVVCALGCALAIGCGGPSAPDKPVVPPSPSHPDDQCTSADECDLADACCGCNAGGKRIAMRKDAIPAFKASFEQRCHDVMCAQFISQDPTCDAEAICGSRGRCRVAPHMQHQ
jgi:hypothetical protein